MSELYIKLREMGFILQRCIYCKIDYWSDRLESFCFDCMRDNCIVEVVEEAEKT
jgi:hypothetical protein